MVETYQKLNPSNARIEIDYKKRNKVKIDYVQHDSAFKVCFSSFLYHSIILHMLVFVAVVMILSPSFTQQIEYGSERDLVGLAVVLLVGLSICLLPAGMALAISKNEKLLRFMPQINYFLSRGSTWIAEFKPKDVKNKKVEIPLFSNVAMDYEATEEFSKYLINVKIIEHDFQRLVKYSKGSKKKPNYIIWKAIFTFNKNPKNGRLEVKFK